MLAAEKGEGAAVATLSDAVILSELADLLQVKVSDLPARYANSIVPRAHIAGYQEVIGALITRGFTMAQVLAFDRLTELERDLSLYFALMQSGAYKRVDEKLLESLDRREELKTIILFIAGVPKAPGDTSEATMKASAGPMNTSTDIFVLDPNAPGRFTIA